MLALLAQFLCIFCDVWLARWVESSKQNELYHIYIYAMLLIFSMIFAFTRSAILQSRLIKAAQELHHKMIDMITETTMKWIDYQPKGRILNRFSTDIGVLDTTLISILDMCFRMFISVLGILILVMILNPIVIIITIPGIFYFIYIRNHYLITSREVLRLEKVTLSPIQSTISTILSGLITIRSMKVNHLYINEFDQHQNKNSRVKLMTFYLQRFLGVRLDIVSALIIIFAAVLAVLSTIYKFNLFAPAYIGLALTQTLGLTQSTQMGIRFSVEVENSFTSVERILEYINQLPQEDQLRKSIIPITNWPIKGNITIKNLSLRYDVNLPYVLKNINLNISATSKIGIVGRTGSGKSSFISCFFRLFEYESGDILIDNVAIKDIGLHDLREKISIIPQTPTLFSGTLKYNLDPYNKYTDQEIWKALELSEMKSYFYDTKDQLDTLITEAGNNLSVGQRQLLCLARAILRNSQILIIDEATANVDLNTDAIIQRNIRETFDHCTILVIAHRLNTIIDYDQILVFDDGHIAESGSAKQLYKQNGIFKKMVDQSYGKSMIDAIDCDMS